MNTTDRVQVGDTTGTSTSTTRRTNPVPPPTEYGWACPRCGCINAPWKSQCDCSRNNYWTVTDGWIYKPYNDEWYKQVYCDSDIFKVHPETTTWKAPSSVCSSDNTTGVKSNPNSTIYTTATNPTVGGSDYWNPTVKEWKNVEVNTSNAQSNSTTYPPNCHTFNYSTPTKGD